MEVYRTVAESEHAFARDIPARTPSAEPDGTNESYQKLRRQPRLSRSPMRLADPMRLDPTRSRAAAPQRRPAPGAGRAPARGQSLVEFSLILLPLFIILLGIIQFGFVFNAYVTMTNAAREGTSVGTIYVYDASKSKAQNDALRNDSIKTALLASMNLLVKTAPNFAHPQVRRRRPARAPRRPPAPAHRRARVPPPARPHEPPGRPPPASWFPDRASTFAPLTRRASRAVRTLARAPGRPFRTQRDRARSSSTAR